MAANDDGQVRELRRIARRAMVERGLAPDFPKPALEQLSAIAGPAPAPPQDLRALPWCSIDNDDSRDLDQLSVSEPAGGGAVKVLVAVADVDVLVEKDTPIDGHARKNTTSVYTAAQIFPMLPERLSTDLTSLNPDVDRAAMVIEYVVAPDGSTRDGAIYRAAVRNHGKLAYGGVGAWLEGKGPLPAGALGIEAQLRAQDDAAQRLRRRRFERGALEFQSIEARPVFQDGRVVALRAETPNRARQLIEEFMVAANGVSARTLRDQRSPSLRRVVRSPERWARIAAVAAEHGESLPGQPDSKALDAFLRKRRAADPLRFPDLSLVIVKLMGAGEYVAEAPGQEPVGHFGLAVRDYSHTTAPNRRFPDLITHRLLKSALDGRPAAYGVAELNELAARCTEMEGAANKVERQVRKSAAALVLQDRVGESFDGVITGAADKGTYVRIFEPPVEGRVVRGERGTRVGDKVRVKLLATDFERGWLDFHRLR